MVATGADVELSFLKTMKKSYLKSVTILATFVRKHGDKFKVNCKLGYGETEPQWAVTVQVYFMKHHPHVSFGGGWKAFARAHQIEVGDWLKFKLVERNRFSVERVTASGNAVIDIFSDDE